MSKVVCDDYRSRYQMRSEMVGSESCRADALLEVGIHSQEQIRERMPGSSRDMAARYASYPAVKRRKPNRLFPRS